MFPLDCNPFNGGGIILSSGTFWYCAQQKMNVKMNFTRDVVPSFLSLMMSLCLHLVTCPDMSNREE